MDSPAKRGPGRPRSLAPKHTKKTGKLVPTGGEAKRIKVSVSPEQESRLASLAGQDQITAAEEVRRLIDQEWERRNKAGEPQK